MAELVNKARKHCAKIFKTSRCCELPFHDFKHTLEVYKHVLKIGAYEKIEAHLLEPLLIAALFHDTGHAYTFAGHEEVSSSYAILFLEKNGGDEKLIKKVCDYILATKLEQEPKDDMERILCDADLFHLGSTSFFKRNSLLRKEWSTNLQQDYSEKAWNSLNIAFLQGHRFYTNYGKEILEPIKQRNIELLKQGQTGF